MSGIRGFQIEDDTVDSVDIKDGGVKRNDLNTAEPGQSVIRKVIAGDNVVLESDGADAGTGDVKVSMKHNLIHNSGRFYSYTDGRWITDSDDNYGPGYFQFAESGGTGANPVYEWEHNGYIVLPGQKIKGLYATARVNNTQISNAEFNLVYIRPKLATGQASGYDADGEITVTQLYRGFWRENMIPELTGQAFSGNTNDMHSGFAKVNDFVVPAFGQIRIYYRPIENATGTRYFINASAWDVV